MQRTLLESPLRARHALRAFVTLFAFATSVALVMNIFSGCAGPAASDGHSTGQEGAVVEEPAAPGDLFVPGPITLSVSAALLLTFAVGLGVRQLVRWTAEEIDAMQ